MRVAGYDVAIHRHTEDCRSGHPNSRFRSRHLVIYLICAAILGGVAEVAWACPSAVLWALRKSHLASITRPLGLNAFLSERAERIEVNALTRSAESGDAKAQYELFQALQGTSESWKGERWLKRSADAGYADAEYEMGHRAEEADNYELAVTWYRKAALQGNADASLNLGWAYLRGTSVPLDCWKAHDLFEQAASKGDAFGAQELADLYRWGDCPLTRAVDGTIRNFGIPRNIATACEWLFITRALGNGPTCDAQVQASLSAAEVNVARHGAEKFLRVHHLKPSRNDWTTAP